MLIRGASRRLLGALLPLFFLSACQAGRVVESAGSTGPSSDMPRATRDPIRRTREPREKRRAHSEWAVCACFTIEAPGQRTLRVLFARLHSAGKAFLDAHGAAFVTGTSSGIGAGVVLAALAAGDRVVATARNLEELRSAIGRPANDRLAFLPLESRAKRRRSGPSPPWSIGLAASTCRGPHIPPLWGVVAAGRSPCCD